MNRAKFYHFKFVTLYLRNYKSVIQHTLKFLTENCCWVPVSQVFLFNFIWIYHSLLPQANPQYHGGFNLKKDCYYYRMTKHPITKQMSKMWNMFFNHPVQAKCHNHMLPAKLGHFSIHKCRKRPKTWSAKM